MIKLDARWEHRGRLLLIAIAAITVCSGALQAFAPGVILGFLGANRSDSAEQGFATVGMFMILFGGIVMHALLTSSSERIVLLWASLQKLGAAGAVGIGVARGVFSTVALIVASFDLFTGGLGLWCRAQLQR